VRCLAVDVGTGTQDILLFDADRELENDYQLILPSPTVLVAEAIHRASEARLPLLLTGATMGGGPSGWAAETHARAGLAVWATPDAARTLDDDLERVRALGVEVIGEDEAAALRRRRGRRLAHVEMLDFDHRRLAAAFGAAGIDLARDVDAVAVAVFDHGAAPPGESDRRYRFAYLARRLDEAEADGSGLAAFAYRAETIPADLTRLAAAAGSVARSPLGGRPIVAMDTAPAAILGALDDRAVRAAVAHGRRIVAANVGNFHALAFAFEPDGRVDGVVEHHTGALTRPRLARFLRRLAEGTLTNAEVFGSMGHGALVRDAPARAAANGRAPLLAVTGPRQTLLGEGRLAGLGRPLAAVPHGDMMLAGCFGLLRGLAALLPEWREPVERRLGPPAWAPGRG